MSMSSASVEVVAAVPVSTVALEPAATAPCRRIHPPVEAVLLHALPLPVPLPSLFLPPLPLTLLQLLLGREAGAAPRSERGEDGQVAAVGRELQNRRTRWLLRPTGVGVIQLLV